MSRDKKSTFRELLLSHDKKKSEATNALAILFRDALATHGVTPSEWDVKVERYYKRRHTNSIGVVDKKRVDQDKSNLTRALAKNGLPWNRFVEGCSVMGPEFIMFSMTLGYPGGLTTEHKLKIRNRYVDLQADLEDDEDKDDVE